MGKQGEHLDVIHRNQMFWEYMAWNSPEDVFQNVFSSDENQISFTYLKNRLKFFDEASSRDIRDYLTVAKTRKENAGRPRIYNAEHDALLMTIMKEKRSRKLYQLRNIISEALQEEFLKVPANSTIWKHLHEQRQRRKRLNRHNVKKNPGLQLAYLERV